MSPPPDAARVTARLGVWLGSTFVGCFVTRLVSHYHQTKWVRRLAVVFGLLLGACGLYAFVTAVPPSEWVRVVVWLGGGVLAHDVILAPLAVVVGFVVIRQAPARARRGAASPRWSWRRSSWSPSPCSRPVVCGRDPPGIP